MLDTTMLNWFRGDATADDVILLLDKGYLRITNQNYGHVAATAKGQKGFERAHKAVTARLEYLRGEFRAERISYGEIAELQSLAKHIQPDDTELLEAAGVPEFADTDAGQGGEDD